MQINGTTVTQQPDQSWVVASPESFGLQYATSKSTAIYLAVIRAVGRKYLENWLEFPPEVAAREVSPYRRKQPA